MIHKPIVIFGVALACATSAWAQQQFDSPEAAAQALIAAADSHDSARLAAIIGPQNGAILTSGKSQQDLAEQSEFARLARARHTTNISGIDRNRAILSIGDEEWPFPVPIVRVNGKWRFDASHAREEMRARRIGANELDAIDVCHGYVDAQKKYAAEDRKRDGMPEYSAHLMSSPGRQDGLYRQGAGQSLIPEGLAKAAWTGAGVRAVQPYHGYYFRVLSAQGPNARGGAHRYMVNNKMIGGFALVAWPAQYGVTGVHTFIVNQDGMIFEKDIAPGAGKSSTATPVTQFDPDRSWAPVE